MIVILLKLSMRFVRTLVWSLALGPVLAHGAPPATAAGWEGSLGLILRYSPDYLGAADSKFHAVPGLYLRYGRYSVTTTGGFVTRQNEEVDRGVTAELVQRDDLRVSLSARFDGGRDADVDPALAGLPDLRPTIRARLAVVKRWPDGWRAALGASPDVLGRGGGTLIDAAVSHEWVLSPSLRATLGTGLNYADRRYLASYFGVTPAQATAGRPAFAPGAGLRDLTVSALLNAQLGPRWIGFAGVGASRLLADAARSPLTKRVGGVGATVGLAWQF